MEYNWEDLPKPLNCFTVRNATMVNLNTGKIVSNYSANTKIVVVQKCVTPKGTFYRTREAENNYLNYAFKASAFGLPDEKAPPVHSSKPNSLEKTLKHTPASLTSRPVKKQKVSQTVASSEGGEKKPRKGWLRNIFRRRHGKAKDT